MSVGVAQITRRRRRNGLLSLLSIPASILASPGAYPIQLAITENGVDKTSDPVTSYASGNIAVVTVDAPTLTSISGVVTQGDSAVSHNIVGTNLVTGQTLGGLTSGATAAAIVASSPTAATVAISATGGATVGTANVYLVDAAHGASGTVALTVSASTTTPPLTGLLRRYVASSGSSTTTNGASVTTWTDTIASKVMTATGTITYLSSGMNSKPAMRNTSNAIGTYFSEAAYDASLNTTATTVVVVLKLPSNPATDAGFAGCTDNGSGNGWSMVMHSVGNVTMATGGSALYGTASGNLGTAGHTMMLTADATTSGAFMDNSSFSTSTGMTPEASVGTLCLFQHRTNAGNATPADIYECLVYNHILTSGEKTALASYVSTTYGI